MLLTRLNDLNPYTCHWDYLNTLYQWVYLRPYFKYWSQVEVSCETGKRSSRGGQCYNPRFPYDIHQNPVKPKVCNHGCRGWIPVLGIRDTLRNVWRRPDDWNKVIRQRVDTGILEFLGSVPRVRPVHTFFTDTDRQLLVKSGDLPFTFVYRPGYRDSDEMVL